MSGFFAAWKVAREQQRRVKEYEDFRALPISERLLEHVQSVVNRTQQPMFVHLDGVPDRGGKGWIEIRPKGDPTESRFRRSLKDQNVDLDEILEAAQKEIDRGVGTH